MLRSAIASGTKIVWAQRAGFDLNVEHNRPVRARLFNGRVLLCRGLSASCNAMDAAMGRDYRVALYQPQRVAIW